MKLDWLDDLLALYSAGSITLAAKRRNISQPAFSRRIQMLEAWLGVQLIDRERKPATLSVVAREREAAVRSLVSGIYEFRAAARAMSKGEAHIAIAAQHSLSSQPLLSLLKKRGGGAGQPTFRLTTGDRQECVAQLLRGDIDILYCYEVPAVMHTVPPLIAKTIIVGQDELVAVGSPSLIERVRKSRRRAQRMPLIIYPRESFFGGLLWNNVLTTPMAENEVEVICVTAFAQAVLDLALAGTGFAWLPRRLAEETLKAGLLDTVDFLGDPVPLKIVAVIGRRSVAALAPLVANVSI